MVVAVVMMAVWSLLWWWSGGDVQECLGTTTTVQLDAPATQLLAVGTQGEIKSTLNVTAGEEGGTVVWQVEEIVRPYTEGVSPGVVLAGFWWCFWGGIFRWW